MGRIAGAIVKDAAPGPQDCLAALSGGPCQRQARRNVVVIVKEVLPVVAQPRRDGEIRAQPVIVLNEAARHHLDKHDVAEPLLLDERVWTLKLEILQARKIVSPAHVGVVIHAAPADIRHVDPRPDVVFSRRPGENLVQVHVVFGVQHVGLSPASGEGSGNHNGRRLADAGGGRVVAAEYHPELIEQPRRDHEAVVVVEFVLAVARIDGCLRQYKASHALILYARIVDIVANGAQVVFRELVGEGGRDLGRPLRIWGGLL